MLGRPVLVDGLRQRAHHGLVVDAAGDIVAHALLLELVDERQDAESAAHGRDSARKSATIRHATCWPWSASGPWSCPCAPACAWVGARTGTGGGAAAAPAAGPPRSGLPAGAGGS